MRFTMFAGLFVLVMGCATTDEADGLAVETADPGLVSGTFTRGGMTVVFELTETTMTVTTLDAAPVFEADLVSSVRVTKAVAEAALLPDLYEKLGTIECPTYPPRWLEFAQRGDKLR